MTKAMETTPDRGWNPNSGKPGQRSQTTNYRRWRRVLKGKSEKKRKTFKSDSKQQSLSVYYKASSSSPAPLVNQLGSYVVNPLARLVANLFVVCCLNYVTAEGERKRPTSTIRYERLAGWLAGWLACSSIQSILSIFVMLLLLWLLPIVSSMLLVTLAKFWTDFSAFSFSRQKYLSVQDRQELAAKLNLTG